MDSKRPVDGATVWIEYPESRWTRAVYRASDDDYKVSRRKTPVSAQEVVNWSAENPKKKKHLRQPQSWLARIAGGVLQAILDAF